MSSKNDRASPRILIIGIGNSFRTDDGAGIAAARRVRDRVPSGVTVIEATGEGAALLAAWREAEKVILMDAVQSGSPPGTLLRLDLLAQKIPRSFVRCSSHAFSVAEAIELARALNRFPPRLIFYGIEGKNFEAGEGLSSEVERALGSLVEQVLEEVRERGGVAPPRAGIPRRAADLE